MISDIQYDVLLNLRDREKSTISKSELAQEITARGGGERCRKELIAEGYISPLTPEGWVTAYELTQKGRAAIEERNLYFVEIKTLKKRFWITTTIAVVGAVKAFMPELLGLWALLSRLLTR